MRDGETCVRECRLRTRTLQDNHITLHSYDKEIDDIVPTSLRLRISKREALDKMWFRYYELEDAVAEDGRGYGGPNYRTESQGH